MKKSGVYIIINIVNGNRYIGSAIDIKRRLRDHYKRLHANVHNSHHLQNAYNLYGVEAFVDDVLEYVDDVSLLIVREQYYLDTLHPEYNLSPTAGSTLGVRHTEETRRKWGEMQKGRVGRNTGKKFSEEWRRNMSKAQKGHSISKEQLQRMNDARKGHPGPNTGKSPSAETRRKLSEVNKGRKLPPRSEEWSNNIREGRKRNRAEKDKGNE